MNDEIGREILKELRKANRVNQAGVGLAILALLLLAVYLVAVRPALIKSRQPATIPQVKQARPWQEVQDALDQFDHQKAVKLLKGIIDREPSHYYGYAYLGNVYLAMGDITNAESQYAKAYELLPDEQHEKKLAAIRKRLAHEQFSLPKGKP
jgi:cytochrome c-type biogenesis protein CcmH/NrfG